MHSLNQLDFASRIAKRAQYEAFEFTLIAEGAQVRIGSHEHPSDHEYLVRIDDGAPVDYPCAHDEHDEGA